MALVLVPCQYCSNQVPAGDMQQHLSSCHEAKREKSRLSQQLSRSRGGGRRQRRGGGKVITFGDGAGFGDDGYGDGIGNEEQSLYEVRRVGLGRAAGTTRRVVGYGGGKALSTQSTRQIGGADSFVQSSYTNGGGGGAFDGIDGGPPLDGGRVRCRLCGRGFAMERIAIHQRICEKLASKNGGRPRPVFHPLKGRVDREALAAKKAAGSARGDSSSSGRGATKGSTWRQQHREFQEIVRMNRKGGSGAPRGAGANSRRYAPGRPRGVTPGTDPLPPARVRQSTP